MENASKALLIAAAVLIAIILICLALKIFNTNTTTVTDAETIGKTISRSISKATSVISRSTSDSMSEISGSSSGEAASDSSIVTQTNLSDLYNNGLVQDGTVVDFSNLNRNLSEYTSKYDDDSFTSDGRKVIDCLTNGWAIMKQDEENIYLVSIGYPYYYTTNTNKLSEVNDFLEKEYADLNFIEEARIITYEEYKSVKDKIFSGVQNAEFAVEDGNTDEISFTRERSLIHGYTYGSVKSYSLRVVLKLNSSVKASQVLNESGQYYWQLSY